MTEQINTAGLYAHPARSAAGMPVVRGMCPSCGLKDLFLASGGHVTCANLRCRNPCAASDALAHK